MPSLRELSRAITGGNLALVQDYLQRGGDSNANERGTTLLMEATNFKQFEVARALVKGGADVNRIDQDGLSALSFALQYPSGGPFTMLVRGNMTTRSVPEVAGRGAQVVQALIELLVKGGAEVSPKLKERYTSNEQLMFKTPLMFAVKQGHFKVIRHLLALGADVNGADYWGKTALQEALSLHQLEIAEMLLDFGAGTQTEHSDLLGKAVDYSGTEIGSFLYEAEKAEKEPDAAALANLQARWCRILARLVAAGADLEHTNKRGHTALFSAVNAGDPVLLRKLIDMGANLEHRVDGANALHYLAGLVRLEEPRLLAMVASFAGTGADFDARDGQNRTATEIAAARGFVDLESALKRASAGGNA